MMDVIKHYRKLIQNYFNDPTEEGKMVKYASLREAENILTEYFSCPPHRLKEIYDEEYRKKYFPGSTPRTYEKDTDDLVYEILDGLRINWVREDLENTLGEANLSPSDKNMNNFCSRLADSVPEISDAICNLVNARLFDIAEQQTRKQKERR